MKHRRKQFLREIQIARISTERRDSLIQRNCALDAIKILMRLQILE